MTKGDFAPIAISANMAVVRKINANMFKLAHFNFIYFV